MKTEILTGEVEMIGRGLGLMLGDILATACIEITRRSASRLPNTDAPKGKYITYSVIGMSRPGKVLRVASN